MRLTPDIALSLLQECTGDDLWSIEHCQARGVPQDWIDELADAYETSYRISSETIYVPDPDRGKRVVNQYYGIRDVDLAIKIANDFGVDMNQIHAVAISRQGIVNAIKEAVME